MSWRVCKVPVIIRVTLMLSFIIGSYPFFFPLSFVPSETLRQIFPVSTLLVLIQFFLLPLQMTWLGLPTPRSSTLPNVLRYVLPLLHLLCRRIPRHQLLFLFGWSSLLLRRSLGRVKNHGRLHSTNYSSFHWPFLAVIHQLLLWWKLLHQQWWRISSSPWLEIWVGINGCSNHLEGLASVWGLDTTNDTMVEWLKQWGRVWWQKYHLNIFILDDDGMKMARRIVYNQ